jgi:hypothetical protein
MAPNLPLRSETRAFFTASFNVSSRKVIQPTGARSTAGLCHRVSLPLPSGLN